jgi:Ala-tRNA(Pro) deacylase
MNRQQIYDYLQENSIWHEITEHKAVYNMAELAEVPCPYPEADAKNLFVRDDKKQNYYLITVKGEKRVNLKAFRKAQGTRNLSFASAEDLLTRLALIPGAVTPLGVLNDETRSVQVFLDQDFLQEPGLVGVHPNENTATVWLKTEDLIRIIREHGNEVVTFRCEE